MLRPQHISPAVLARRRSMETVNPAGHPAARAPRIFADSATIEDIEPLVQAGIINGVTTNPTLLKKAGARSQEEADDIMRRLCALLAPNPVSLELTALDEAGMLEQATHLATLGDNAVIKVPVGGYRAVDPALDPHTGLKVLRRLWGDGIRTNATLVFNTTQAFWAANAGATYVSPFLGRLADHAYANDKPERPPGNSLFWLEDHKNSAGDQQVANTGYVAGDGARLDAGTRLVHEIVAVFANYDIHTEVLAASIRNAVQLSEMLLAGADILTVPAALLHGVADHPLSDAGLRSFADDAQVFSAG